jgi:hypothetical protein
VRSNRRRIGGIVLAGLLAVLAGRAVFAAADKGSAADFERALAAPPEVLARNYLTASEGLKWTELAKQGATIINVTPDGEQQTINPANVSMYVARYQAALKTYTKAIEKRGFRRLGRVYKTEISPDCGAFGFTPGNTEIVQDGFKIVLTHGSFKGDQAFRGVVVESVLYVRHLIDRRMRLPGRVSEGHIELALARTGCSLTLTGAVTAKR